MRSSRWPVLRSYEGEHLRRVAAPLGGIGTGTVSLGGRGDLRDWEVMNRPAKGYAPACAFFALAARSEGGAAVRRVLEGPLDPADFDGGFGAPAPQAGLPRFAFARFLAAYPLFQVELEDPEAPIAARLEAFNPLVLADADASGLPLACLRWVLVNPGPRVVEAAVCGSLPNFVGRDGKEGRPEGNRNEPLEAPGLRGVALVSDGVDRAAPQWGSLALVASGHDDVSVRTAWADLSWGDSLLDFWDDLEDARLEERDAGSAAMPIGSVCARIHLDPGQEKSITFLLGWHFPNRMSWDGGTRIGNYYAERFVDAAEVLRRSSPELPDLERRTVEFVSSFLASDVPPEILEAALFNVSSLRSQTCFRTPDGTLFGWEGCGDHDGCCEGSCTHVWNYEWTTPHLFGELARSMRRVEFAHATRPDGLMSFRVRLPLDGRAQEWSLAAADGQMGCLVKLHREWRLSGDDDFLRELWPHARRALEFAWIPGGWDADRDGLMEGCQHNTMDVEYYGPNPEMGTWYLAALRAAEEMARHVGEAEFAAECRRVFESGRERMDRELFDGEYYEHHIVAPTTPPAPGLRHESMGARNLGEPELQLGAGCVADQLVGELDARLTGLGPLLEPRHVRTALETIFRRNFRAHLRGHFNHLRTYALQDEGGLLVATYPEGRRPPRPFPYFNEVWTGIEYTAAAHMLVEGMAEEGLAVVRAARARYDGRCRNPFDEVECGHHYVRAMAAWACYLAASSFHYDGRIGEVRIADKPGSSWFWSTGDAWGTIRIGHDEAALAVSEGRLFLRSLEVGSRRHEVEPANLGPGAELRLPLGG